MHHLEQCPPCELLQLWPAGASVVHAYKLCKTRVNLDSYIHGMYNFDVYGQMLYVQISLSAMLYTAGDQTTPSATHNVLL